MANDSLRKDTCQIWSLPFSKTEKHVVLLLKILGLQQACEVCTGYTGDKSPNPEMQPHLKLSTGQQGQPGQGVHKGVHLEMEGHLGEMKG